MTGSRKREAVNQDGPTSKDRKLSHVAAEKKRRETIRRGFDQITAVVPELELGQSRSEALVLEKTVKLLKDLLNENTQLRDLATKNRINVPGFK